MITKKDIESVANHLLAESQEKLFAKTQEELEGYWHFEWDDAKHPVMNAYRFFDLLELYRGFCRRWEEHHNGSCCVVERVRDKYLMPKINDFVNKMADSALVERLEGLVVTYRSFGALPKEDCSVNPEPNPAAKEAFDYAADCLQQIIDEAHHETHNKR